MSGPERLTADLLRAMPLPAVEGDGGKDARGRVLVVAGSTQTPGAALLAAHGALRSGAGKLQIATVRSLAPHLAVAMPEALVIGLPETEDGGIAPEGLEEILKRAERCDGLLFGPGLPEGPETNELTARLLAGLQPDGPTIVLDAAALSGLADQREVLARFDGRVAITPHCGEMASLLDRSRDEIEDDPAPVAREVAERLGVAVALKGSTTYVAAPDGRAWRHEGGSIGLGTSGSGDTLAGLVAGLAARGADVSLALLWGVFVHGRAGALLDRRVGRLGYLARELPPEFPGILADVGGAGG
jgi:hydroxyethylthiazole kinase-like uncharacterized protein yjeF